MDNQNENQSTEPPDELVITLRKPVVVGDQVCDTLNLREPTAGEFEKFAKLASTNAAGAILALISWVSGVAPPIVQKIPVRDMTRASEYLMGFMKSGQLTQTTSSES